MYKVISAIILLPVLIAALPVIITFAFLCIVAWITLNIHGRAISFVDFWKNLLGML